MMPSRGLRLGGLRLHSVTSRPSLSCRQLSTASQSLPTRLTVRASSQIRSQWPASRMSAICIVPGVRFASSSTSTSASAAAPSDAPNPTDISSFSNLDTITFDTVESTTITDGAAEGIGYLYNLAPQLQYGFGYGPTSILEYSLEYFHFYGGLPWWGAITATALLARLVTLPLSLRGVDFAARNLALNAVLQPKIDKMNKLMRAGDQPAAAVALQEWAAARSQGGLHFKNMLLPPIAQGIIGFCGFRLTRAMALLPVPGLDQGGPLWMTDLTLSDPYLLFPALLGLSLHLMFRLGGDTGAMTQQPPAMRMIMLYGMPGMIAVITGFQAGTTVIWFTASTVFGIFQTVLLRNSAVRRWCGVAPIYKPPPGAAPPVTMQDAFKGFMAARSASSTEEVKSRYASGPQYEAPSRPGKIINVKAVDSSSKSSDETKPQSYFESLTSMFGKNKQEKNDPKMRAAEAYEKRMRSGR